MRAMQKLELEKKTRMRMVNSDELLRMDIITDSLEKLAMKYEDLYFLVDNEGVKGIAIPTYRQQLIETFKRRKPIKRRDIRIIEIIENGLRQECILIML